MTEADVRVRAVQAAALMGMDSGEKDAAYLLVAALEVQNACRGSNLSPGDRVAFEVALERIKAEYARLRA